MSDAQAGRRYVEGEQEHYGQDPYTQQHQQYPGYQGYGPYDGQPQQQGYPGYQEPGYYQQPYPQSPYPQQYPPNYPQQAGYPQQPQQPQQPLPHIPQQAAPRHEEPPADASPSPEEKPNREFHTEQFAFIEEDDGQAEDVIDWLKFTESRTERRDERKRRGRKRVIALIVLLVLALVGGVGYLWQTGKLPGLGNRTSQGAAQATGDQKRDVIVVHLRPVDSTDSSTALLVGNETTGKGATVLVPNSLIVSTDDGSSTTLGKSVVNQGEAPTRDALNTLLNANIQGTWRLDTPFLEILVDSIGDITVDTDATITSGGKTLVTAGKGQDLDGQAAVAYATYRASGETSEKQLARFGQVMQAVLMKMPSAPGTATKIVQNLGSIPDPSLSDGALGATLAHLSDEAKSGSYTTTTLPVQGNGTLSRQAIDGVVKGILGGTVKNTSTPGTTPTVAVKNATGRRAAASSAQVSVVNSGDTYVDDGTSTVHSRSQVIYSSEAYAQAARELAKTLGLPDSAVTKGTGSGNAAITVILGSDYRG